MRVTHKMLANAVSRNIQRNLWALQKRSNQLSTGKVFDRPSQDPVGTYRSMRISSTGLARNHQYNRNIGEAKTWLNATENALADGIDVIHRLRELAVYASNDALSAEDRKAMAPEVEQLLNHLISVGNAEVAGLFIFGGHKTQESPYRIAGASGHLLDDWYNAQSGLTGTLIRPDNLTTGSYAVSTLAGLEPELTQAARADLLNEYLQGARDGFFGGYSAATLTAGDTNQDNAVLFTAREAGFNGNHINIQYVDPGAEQPLTVNVSGTGQEDDPFVIQVSLETDGDGNITSTAKQVADAINNDETASALVRASVNLENNGGGSGIVSLDDFTEPLFLAGGAGGFSGVYASDEDGYRLDDSPWNGTLALEVQEAKKFGQLPLDVQETLGETDEQDMFIRLSVGFQLYDLAGKNYSGTYGSKTGEEIYINMTRLKEEGQTITFQVKDGDDAQWLSLELAPNANITYEIDQVMVGDKAVYQLNPHLSDENNSTYDRLTLHREYGRLDAQGLPTMGDNMDWHFAVPEDPADKGFFDESTRTLKFFDIDQATGRFITSSISTTFETFSTALAGQYYDRADLEKYGVPDEEFADHPAAIFSFIAPGEPYYMGDDGQRLVEISTDQRISANITGIEAFGVTDVFNTVREMHQALIHNHQFALSNEVIEKLDDHLDALLQSRSDVGARMERLDITEDRLHSERIYLRELLSKVEDIDMADAITEFMMQENAYQAALATGARMVYPSLIDFLR